MNILILNGSPRHHGNTHAVLQTMKGILEDGNIVEVLDVCNLKLSGCCACDSCKRNGGHCVCPDESDAVIQKIIQADAVIFGTPVYWWGMSAQLKMVVDKFYSQDSQFKTMHKKIGVMVVGANELENPQYRLIHEQFRCIAEYLHWEPAFSMSFSAYEPGELMMQDGVFRSAERGLCCHYKPELKGDSMMKKLVVVTGASSGIGMEFAKRFSSEGHPVLMLARRKEVMEELNLPNCLCRSVDVTDLSAMQAAIQEAEDLYGKTDLLINCAGLMLLGYPAEQDFEEWSRMIDVNVKGVLAGTKAVLADMMARNEGTIINISSIAGRKTFDNHSVYCGTKYAVHAITESMRKEVSGSNVRMVVIAPGVVETPLLSHTSSQEIKNNYNLWKQSIEGGLEPSQIADCAWFAYQMPQNVCVREIVIAKTKQED